jgi:protein involved in polysaccharide export with SLBB domain
MIGILRNVAFVTLTALLIGCSSVSPPEFTSEPQSTELLAKESLAREESRPQNEPYRIHAGDLLRVISPDSSPIYEARVRQDGTFEVPPLGKFVAVEKTIDELEAELMRKDSRYTKGSLRISDCCLYFYVAGEVQAPGPKTYDKRVTVSQVIREAGGFTKFANTNPIKLIRANGANELVKFGNTNADPQVYPGDTIEVKRGRAALATLETNTVDRFRIADVLTITAPEISEPHETLFRIQSDGTILITSVGKFVAAGRTARELHAEIAEKDFALLQRRAVSMLLHVDLLSHR